MNNPEQIRDHRQKNHKHNLLDLNDQVLNHYKTISYKHTSSPKDNHQFGILLIYF